MAEQVKVPGVGPVSKKALLIGGGAGALLIAVLWWRKRSTPVTPDTSTADTTGDDGSGMAGGGGALAGGGTSTNMNTAPATNAAWTQLVMDALAGVTDPQALSLALGLYLTGSAVTVDQEHLIDQAIAVAGYPPVAGPIGYPPGIRTQPATGQTVPPPATRPPLWSGPAIAPAASRPPAITPTRP